MTNGVLNQVTVTDNLPKGLTYVEGSLTSEGDQPEPTSLTYKDGTITAEYGKISDTKARSIIFKVKVNKGAVSGKEILNIATVDDHVTPPDKPEVPVVPEDPDQPNKPDVPVVPGKEVPNRPEPRKPAPKEKEARKSFLPKTGEEISYTLIALGGILVVIVMVVAVKKRKQ